MKKYQAFKYFLIFKLINEYFYIFIILHFFAITFKFLIIILIDLVNLNIFCMMKLFNEYF